MADLPLHEDSIDEEPVVEVVDENKPGFFGRLFGGSQKRSWIGNAPSPGNKVRGPTHARSQRLSRIDASTTFE